MSDAEQRFADNLTLMSEAYRSGRLDAFADTRDVLAVLLRWSDDRILVGADPTDRMKARGASDVLKRAIAEVKQRIACVEAEREGR